ncbi:MAG: hypothetical protein IKJ68_05445 [Clostridia bacterium]|nr:hypothetical protein [Clostridia bacterium]
MKRKVLSLIFVFAVMCSFVFGTQGTVIAQDAPVVQAYTGALSKHQPFNFTWETSLGETRSVTKYSKYTIYDIDKDLVPEMLVHDVKDGKLYVYSIKNGALTSWCDYVDYYTHDSFFEFPGGNGIVAHGGGMGLDHYEYIYRYSFSPQGLVPEETLVTGYCLDETLSQLHAQLSWYKKIEFKDSTDLSLINSLNTIKVTVNGTQIWFDQQPTNENGRVLVPIRPIFEALGYTLEWNGETGTAVATSSTNTITVQAGNHTITYDGQSTYWCDVAPKVVSGRMMVPVRAASESAGCIVNWNGDINLVEITSN